MPASRPMVGMRQQDGPAAPASSPLPQRRVSGSTASLGKRRGKENWIAGEGKLTQLTASVRGNHVKGETLHQQSDLYHLSAATLHIHTSNITLWNRNVTKLMD
ncbi:unnamed protein product [Pleuronectes platessa]|uniref:Uncharacterized protein n=1 Tax=Pleuronectes platessa TaxID=8262 RepID=A0A9N7UG71_PLEPL|nr:unnamed protein product [Pleuronectes platessa]